MINAKGIQGHPNPKHVVHPVEGYGPQVNRAPAGSRRGLSLSASCLWSSRLSGPCVYPPSQSHLCAWLFLAPAPLPERAGSAGDADGVLDIEVGKQCCSGCGSSVSPARGTVEGDGGLGVRDASPLPSATSDPVGTIARFLINSGRFPSNKGISGKGQVNF